MIFSIRVASRARREKRHTPRRFPDRDWDRPISVPRRFRPCFPFRRRLTPKSPVYIHLSLNRAGDIKRGAVQKENIIDSAPGRLSPTGKDTEERRCAYGLTRLRTMPGQWRQSGLTATGLSDLPDSNPQTDFRTAGIDRREARSAEFVVASQGDESRKYPETRIAGNPDARDRTATAKPIPVPESSAGRPGGPCRKSAYTSP